MAAQFKYLFSPLKIGPVTVKNRIFMGPHGKGYGEHVLDRYHIISEREIDYIAERIKGGAGLIILGVAGVHPTYGGSVSEEAVPAAFLKEEIPRYRKIAEIAHQHGAKVFLQLYHPGMQTSGEHDDDFHEVWCPSFIPGLSMHGNAKTMEVEDIKAVVDGFALCTRYAREGGLDGIEIHGCHQYLLHQFLSPLSNKRTDHYGGSLENRMRIYFEIIDAVRGAAGKDMAVGMRVSGDGFTPGDVTIEDMKGVAARLEATGKLDYMTISSGGQWTVEAVSALSAPSQLPPAATSYLAAAIKGAVKSLLVFAVNRINDPVIAERILADGQADMVGMVRPLIADPELPRKAMEGRLDEIRHCMGCMQGCMGRRMEHVPIGCVQNPAAGRERRLGSGTLVPASRKKRVMVIGGGPAGLKAAEIAARRGHQVTLYEKENELGGQVRLAAKTPLREEFGEVARYLTYTVRSLGVTIRTGAEVTPDMVAKENADAVIVATGCLPGHSLYNRSRFVEEVPPGIDGKNVVSVWDILGEKVKPGKRVAIVDAEGHYRTLCLADLLVDRGHEVQMVTPRRDLLSRKLHTVDGALTFRRLRDKGVKFVTSARIKAVTPAGLTLSSPAGDNILPADTIVWATAAFPNDKLYFDLKGKVKELHRIGDCVIPRLVDFAIWEGEIVGREL